MPLKAVRPWIETGAIDPGHAAKRWLEVRKLYGDSRFVYWELCQDLIACGAVRLPGADARDDASRTNVALRDGMGEDIKNPDTPPHPLVLDRIERASICIQDNARKESSWPAGPALKLFREMRAEQERLASILGKVADAVTQIATTQVHHTEVLTRRSEILESMDERLQIAEGRLNTIIAGLLESRSTRDL